ncbi:hypothetical protein LJK87_28785 [Paenibacillus sp. P25]|nr:hypothetical protein LJK87_28785 [Paenibacillus sp. P25]
MIFGALRDFERNRGQYGEAVRRALGFVAGLDIREMPATLEIDGKRLFVMKQNPAAAPFEEQLCRGSRAARRHPPGGGRGRMAGLRCVGRRCRSRRGPSGSERLRAV